MTGALANHLWQSTAFAVAVALLTIVFRNNQARVRYALWFSASLKFFIPFAVLISAGGRYLPSTEAQRIAPAVSVAVTHISEPFEAVALESLLPSAAAPVDWLGLALIGVWLCGLIAVASTRLQSWRRVRSALFTSTPLRLACAASNSLEIRSSPCLLEPGVVGFRRPVLLLPADLVDHLTPPQLEAVLAHELCHVRRRDNMTAAVHMLAEMVFWFHPLVWWIGARLVDERERACDEHVLDVVGEPKAYAEGILTVCKRYVEAPHPCMSGVSGADLRKRIEAIMFNRVGVRLTTWQRATLALSAVVALLAPFVVGVLGVTARAQVQKFEVASIRRCEDDTPPPPVRAGARQPGSGTINFRPDGITVRCGTVERLLQLAYSDAGRELTPRLKDGPAWTRSDRFTVVAKAETATDRRTMSGPMLRSLLEERFQLKMHSETEDAPIYAMALARGGLKIRPNKDGDCLAPDQALPKNGTRTLETAMAEGEALRAGTKKPVCGSVMMLPGFLYFGGTTMGSMAQYLSSRLDRPVVDQTAVEGTFNVLLEFGADDRAAGSNVRATSPGADPPDAGGPSMFAALEQIGLKIDSTKGPRQLFVIDRIERPTPD
jgi:uncharacterized protein (TIGR03435 family)